jgi:menaquinone-dependent protoporphyrinogen oxidase
MKTMILYSTTYGYAEEIAKSIASHYPEATLQNIQKNKIVDLTLYDHVILGGSVYMGKVHKKLAAFAAMHEGELLTKKLGLYLCCIIGDKYMDEMKANFPLSLIEHAYATENFGGKLQTDKMNFMHKMIMKMVAKSEQGKEPVVAYPERVEHFVKQSSSDQ